MIDLERPTFAVGVALLICAIVLTVVSLLGVFPVICAVMFDVALVIVFLQFRWMINLEEKGEVS